MKHMVVILLITGTIFPCATANRIIMIKDSSGDAKGFKLVQDLKASSSAKTGKVTLNQFFNTEVTYQFNEKDKAMPLVHLIFTPQKLFIQISWIL